MFQGGLTETYGLNEIHFRWGSWKNRGSEHRVHGKQYSAEIQMLHVNEKLGREFTEALTQGPIAEEKYAMFSVFIDVGDHHNEAFEPIIRGLRSIQI